MAVALVRIDDRLVHGQVVEGWLKSMRITQLIVASDTVAADDTQKALYLLAVPHGIKLSCLSVREAAAAWNSAGWAKERVLVLVSNPQDVQGLIEQGATIASVNVGGMHFREGRVQILKAISINDNDVAVFKKLLAQSVLLEVRPLPLDEPIDLKPYIERWQDEREALEQPR